MSDLKYDIIRNIGLLGQGSKGWKKEVNIISWNDRKPKLDIRDWDENHDKMGRGITLHSQEVENLKGILNNLDLEELKQGAQDTQDVIE
ncbi:MAG: PC4/YdbC family ssDNA-binding protein [Eubacteriales bacterium]|nr:PC4/YdbC family ssDNA-binding protein [Eubacteriales bacterium]